MYKITFLNVTEPIEMYSVLNRMNSHRHYLHFAGRHRQSQLESGPRLGGAAVL